MTGYQGYRLQPGHASPAISSTSTSISNPRPNGVRAFHICLNPDSLEEFPELLDFMVDAGMHQIWLPAFFYGYWPYQEEARMKWHRTIEERGIKTGVINIPLGHPGDSLGAMHGNIPLTPPEHWSMGQYPDGRQFSGTSLHPPASEENVAAVRKLAEEGAREIFLDDDFRLAVTPGMIGGCFCDKHKKQFLDTGGYAESDWEELLDAVHHRNPTPLLRSWIEFTCDELTNSFQQQQAVAPDARLGNMVMYFGSEKAGIRLNDYRNALFRVGESKFSDPLFTPIKGKTDALFSCLFHRRYAQPELAYSETTAYPADQLSARNIAAKLAITTLADVRNTMFMSGLTPYPIEHWDTIIPAMRHNAALHEYVAGMKPQGPLKHYWGDYNRLVGNDDPYSLFLALGIPFAVCDVPADDGWTFLSDADTQGFRDGAFKATGTRFITRQAIADNSDVNDLRTVPETLEGLFSLKHEIIQQLDESVPYVVEDIPIICAWYPEANTVLVWNPAEETVSVTLRFGKSDYNIQLEGLEINRVYLS